MRTTLNVRLYPDSLIVPPSYHIPPFHPVIPTWLAGSGESRGLMPCIDSSVQIGALYDVWLLVMRRGCLTSWDCASVLDSHRKSKLIDQSLRRFE